MPSPRLAVRAVIVDQGHLLLARYDNGSDEWFTTPGGGVERGETLSEAFAREMFEETGLALPFGDVVCVREVIADRLTETFLPAGFHQVEMYVRSQARRDQALAPQAPDRNQCGLEWVPLSALPQITFFPQGLTAEFQRQQWPRFYYGAMR